MMMYGSLCCCGAILLQDLQFYLFSLYMQCRCLKHSGMLIL